MSNNVLVEYIQRKQANPSTFTIFSGVDVTFENMPPFDAQTPLRTLENQIPRYLVEGLRAIVLGHFKDKHNNRSFYRDGKLYISVKNIEDLLSDTTHEIAHYVFDKYPEILEIPELQNEFLQKRKILFDRLEQSGYKPTRNLFANIAYSKELDEYLTNGLGYEKVTGHIVGIFPDVYSITSNEEYLAVSFEYFFSGDAEKRSYIRDVCPQVFKKFQTLVRN